MKYKKIRLDYTNCEKGRFYRILLVNENLPLSHFGCAVVAAFKGKLGHAFMFESEGSFYVHEAYLGNGKLSIEDYSVRFLENRFRFIYDMGDSWEFIGEIYEETNEIDSNEEVIMVDGAGQGIWEDNRYILDRYLRGEIAPDTLEDAEMGLFLPWNFKNETFKRIVNEFWDNIRRCLNRQATPNFDVPFTKRELVYENLKRIVESNKDLNNSITIGNYHTGSLSDIVTVRTDVIDDTSNPIYKEMGINALGALKGITGLNGILDDKIWSSKDKGTILLSSDKKSFFKMKNDGTFEKGWKLDYKNEFVDIMDSINEN
jgi:hypothetical protein